MEYNKKQANSVLAASTVAFSACFAVWVIFSIIGIPIKSLLNLSETQFGLLVSMPILSGSLMRLPVGILTDRYGGRQVFVILLMSIILPLYLIGSATEYWQFLVLGFFVGIAGSSFTVGVAYSAKWFPPARRGLAMGIFGAGNAGAAITNILAPSILIAWGWQSVPKIYAIAMIVVIILFWFFTYDEPKKENSTVSLKEQLALIRDPKIWKYCQYYSLVFGGFVGLSLWITKYYITEYGLDLMTAALIASIFVLPSGLVRAFGGWLSDKFGAYIVTWSVLWVSWVTLFLLSYPQTIMTINAINGDDWVFGVGLNVWVFTALLFVLGIAWGLGKASVFKALADEYPDNLGMAAGVVGLAGGLGGFLLPILFGLLIDFTRVNSSVFMLLYGATSVSLVLMFFTFGRDHKEQIKDETKEALQEKYILNSMADVVKHQREELSKNIQAALSKCSDKLSWLVTDDGALENKLQEFATKLDHYKSIYVLDAQGVQITPNLTPDGKDDDSLGRNRASRPYMKNMFGDADFHLSESYISKNKKRPSLTAIHVIRDNQSKRLGFLGVDYDLRKLPRKGALYHGSQSWSQIKGDPSIRGGLFAQQRNHSEMDDNLNIVFPLLYELLTEHGLYYAKIHFSSNRASVSQIEDPYTNHLLGIESLLDPDICLAYPNSVYSEKAIVPEDKIYKVFLQFKELRFGDETIYLRAGSLNVISGMVALNFSCDGSHYMRYDEFLDKNLEFWFGTST